MIDRAPSGPTAARDTARIGSVGICIVAGRAINSYTINNRKPFRPVPGAKVIGVDGCDRMMEAVWQAADHRRHSLAMVRGRIDTANIIRHNGLKAQMGIA
jgi:hypothetical protein